jgi:alkaline phosphatase
MAEVWNYPQPDTDRDVKDTAFYQAPADDGLIPNITAGRPRRAILLIGDGMSFNHVAIARLHAVGPAGRLYMEQMPVLGLVRTHSANQLVTDSAAAATALACGVKTDNDRIGTTPDGTPWQSILGRVRDKGFRTALVATSTISHATPAGFAAHVASRGSEADIAAQMIDNRVDILFGGGRKHWLPAPAGSRKDDRNLIEEARAAGCQIAYSREQLAALKPGPALGLFADDGMTTFAPEPMLADMARTAIRLLNTKTDWFAPDPRFFIMIEGSQIDWAAHGNDADNTIRQTLLFDMAVKEALDFAKRDKHTLVIVTSDHETGGLLVKADKKIPAANWNSKNHTAGDVPLYAFGPGSPHFAGTHDNTDIPRIIARLLGVDNFPAPLKTLTPKSKAR